MVKMAIVYSQNQELEVYNFSNLWANPEILSGTSLNVQCDK